MAEDLFIQDDQTQSDPSKNYLTELVGENRKFKSPEDLARGKYESDNYIKILERRLDEMRSDYLELDTSYKSRAKLEEIVDQLSNNRQPQSSSEQTPSERREDTAPFDPKQIESLVSSEIQKHENQRKQSDNYNMLEGKLKERFGDSYKSAFKSQIDKAGISEGLAKDLALNHPNVLLRALGLEGDQARESYQNPISSDRRTDNFAPAGREKRSWSYYEKMRKEQPELYREPKIAVQMQKDYDLLGKDFEDGDFHN